MKDIIVAKNKWVFNEEVTSCFDDMLSRSIPDYNTMRDLVLRLSIPFLKDKEFDLLDVGSSNGIEIEMFINKYGNKGTYTGIDNSKPMVESSINRLKKYDSKVNIIYDDIFNITLSKYDIVTCVLTMQFIDKEKRELLLNKMYNSLKDNGVLIVVEKVINTDKIYDDLFIDTYYDIKEENGYTKEQIMAKKKSLEGVLVPNTHEDNINLLRNTGFTHIETFWRCINFEGYIAIK